MYKVIRRIIDVSDEDNEKILSEVSGEYKDLPTAIFEFNKAKKADRAMYRVALNYIANRDYIFDDWHDDVSYMFRIKDICIECELENALKKALDMYRLEK